MEASVEKLEEYLKLRLDFPDTVFVVIFQKTTSGTIRGGSKIIFDTPVCMNVYREGASRLVEMRKSRYGRKIGIFHFGRCGDCGEAICKRILSSIHPLNHCIDAKATV